MDGCDALVEAGEVTVAFLLDRLHLVVQVAPEGDFLLRRFLFDPTQSFLAGVFIDSSNDVLGKVQHPVQVAAADIQQKAEVAGYAPGVPDMSDRGGQFDVAHTFAPDRRPRDFHPALIANDAPIAHILVFAAVALPVFRWPEDGYTEKAILFWPQPAVVDRFG